MFGLSLYAVMATWFSTKIYFAYFRVPSYYFKWVLHFACFHYILHVDTLRDGLKIFVDHIKNGSTQTMGKADSKQIILKVKFVIKLVREYRDRLDQIYGLKMTIILIYVAMVLIVHYYYFAVKIFNISNIMDSIHGSFIYHGKVNIYANQS